MGDVRNPAAEGSVQALRGRGRHRRHVLHLQVAEEQPHPQSGRHDRARRADLHALPRDGAPRGLRPAFRRSAREAGAQVSVPGRRARQASRPEDQGVLRRQPGQPVRGGHVTRHDQEDRGRAREAAGSHPADRRRLRHLRAGLPFADGRVPEEHHRRLLVQQVFRLHRLAPRHHRGPRGQHLRRDDRQAIPSRSRSCWTNATAGSRSSRASSRSSTASWRTAATSH